MFSGVRQLTRTLDGLTSWLPLFEGLKDRHMQLGTQN